MSPYFIQRDHLTAAKQAAEVALALENDPPARRSVPGRTHDRRFQPNPVFRPEATVVPLGSDQRPAS